MKKILICFLLLYSFVINVKAYSYIPIGKNSLYYPQENEFYIRYVPNIRMINNPKNITLKNIDKNGNYIWEITYDNLGRPVLQKLYRINDTFFSDIDKNIDINENLKTTYSGYFKFDYPDDNTITEEFFYINKSDFDDATYKLDENKQIIEKYFPKENKTQKFDRVIEANKKIKYTYDNTGLIIKKERQEFSDYNDECNYYYDEDKKLSKLYCKDIRSSNGKFDEYIFLYDKDGNIVNTFLKPYDYKNKKIKTETMAYDKYGHRIKYKRKYQTSKLIYAINKPIDKLMKYPTDFIIDILKL